MEQYTVSGMSCAACSARVEKAVQGVPGVTDCSVSLLTHSMGVEGTADPAAVVAAVEAAGYGARLKGGGAAPAREEDALRDRETPALRRRLFTSLGFWLLLMYVSMGHTMWGWPLPAFFGDNPMAIGLLELLLTGAVMVIDRQFFVSGFRSLWHRAPNMDALVALGSAAAFVYSTAALFAMTAAGEAAGHYLHELYYESAATILTLITLGKLLEARSKGKTTSALRGLMDLAPRTAAVEREGVEVTLPVAEVRRGDIFLLRPGDSIPVDGTVLSGESAVDEASLTGESIPVDKGPGSAVSAGTINHTGFLRCEATRVGEDTTLAQIIRMVSDAAATKAPIAKTADKVSGVFVPVVMALAAVTAAVWLAVGEPVGFALARGISVLVISCPCALGLATPVAIMVGSGVAAKNGILFKTAAALEATGRTGIVALDKTGTITGGRPRVTDILPVPGVSREALLTAACAIESKSEHPLARAVCRQGEEAGIAPPEVTDFRALPGHGVAALWEGKPLLGGSLAFLAGELPVPEAVQQRCAALAQEGKTPLLFAREGALLGVIAAADTVKPDSAGAIRQLRDMGLRVVMLTGDNERTARAIGQRVGVDEVIAGVLPGEKEGAVRKLRESGRVLMVGDGINDAPALTAADIGMAIGAGADVAIDAADVVLMQSRLSDVPAAIRLSRATLRNIRENLFWAFAYNTVGIPIAAGVFIRLWGWQLNPMLAAAAMSLSSFCVVTNALRLNLFRLHDKPSKKDPLNDTTKITKEETRTMEKTLKIEGMMCQHCEMHTKNALEAVDGVEKAAVSHEKGTAVVTLTHDVPDAVLREAVQQQGYTVTGIE